MLSVEVKNWGSADDGLWQSFPELARFLFLKSWNGYDPRECGMITIVARPTGVTAWLKLPSEAQQISVLVTRVLDVFPALEHALLHRSGDWKELKNGPGAQKLREERKKLRETRKEKC